MFICLLISISYCTVIGIDLGSDSIKVAIGSQQKGVHRVRDNYKNDFTPNIFTYTDRSNWAYGEGAVTQCRVYPETCIQNQKLPLNDNTYFGGSLKGYEITAVALKQTIKNIIKKLKINATHLSVVVAIPPSMTNREKSYLYSSLTISNINCIQFITTTYAPIETFVNEQSDLMFNTAVFVDIGHEGVRVSGFEYSYNKITQKLGLFKDGVGGKRIDEILLKMIVDRYKIILSNPTYNNDQSYDNKIEYKRNKYLLLAKIRKARETLTTEEEVTFEYKNLNITLNRQDIEKGCADTKTALTDMLTTLKNEYRHLLKSGEIQLIGGCSRIPCLQNHIQKVLQNIDIVKRTTRMLSVCKGACYVIDTEVLSSVKEHNALVTSKVLMKYDQNEFKLFSPENYENFNPVVQLKNVNQNSVFEISDHDQVFCRLKIVNLPITNRQNTIDFGFTLNYHLMPIPDEPELLNPTGGKVQLSTDYINVGWEISPQDLASSKKVVHSMCNYLNQQPKVDIKSEEIEDYKTFIRDKLDHYFAMNWRKISYAAIEKTIDYQFQSCLKENDYECPRSRLDQIMENFKSSVSYLKLGGLENYDRRREYRNSIQIARDSAKGLLKSCKAMNAKCDDVEKWISSQLEEASSQEIYKYINVLKDRIRAAEMNKNDEL